MPKVSLLAESIPFGQKKYFHPKKVTYCDILLVKAPATAAEQQEDIDPEDGDDFVDPFDTTIVDKVIPVRKAIKSADLAVEDEDFNPTSTFNSTKEEIGM